MRTASPATPLSVRQARADAPRGAGVPSAHAALTRVALGQSVPAALGSPPLAVAAPAGSSQLTPRPGVGEPELPAGSGPPGGEGQDAGLPGGPPCPLAASAGLVAPGGSATSSSTSSAAAMDARR
eukprot:15477859-Alexandrium_andersonii.AAC.1